MSPDDYPTSEELEKATSMLTDKLMSLGRLRHKELASLGVEDGIQDALDATWESGISLEKWVDDAAAHYSRTE
jgi:hypothetical protein